MATNVFEGSLEAANEMSLANTNTREQSELVNLVGDAALALVKVINHLPSPAKSRIYRDLKRALAHLVAEIKSSEILQALGRRQPLRILLKKLAQSLSSVLNEDYI